MVAFLVILLGFLTIVTPVSAATTATILSSPSSVTTDTPFDSQASINGEPNTSYYIKGRIGINSSSLTKGLTNNSSNNPPDDWLTDNDSWLKFPTVITNSNGFWQGSLQIKASSTATTGNNLLVFRIRKVGVTTTHDSPSKTISLSSSNLSSPTPTSSLTPSPTSTPPLTSGSSSSSSFTTSNMPAQINSDQSFDITISLSLPDNPNTNFYLKGAFRHPDKPSNYFGLTKVGSSWVKNSSTYTNQYKITTNSSGNWSGNLEIKPDANDSGFIGSGEYLFKVARYEGSNLTWSNESNIQITAVENTDQGDISLDSSSSTTTPSSSPQSEQSAKSKTASSQSKSYDKQSLPSREGRLIYHTASVAAATVLATPSATTEVKSQKQMNYFNWAGVLMILSGTLVLAFVYLRSSNLRETIFNIFRKRN